jgi:hypothetical protein
VVDAEAALEAVDSLGLSAEDTAAGEAEGVPPSQGTPDADGPAAETEVPPGEDDQSYRLFTAS